MKEVLAAFVVGAIAIAVVGGAWALFGLTFWEMVQAGDAEPALANVAIGVGMAAIGMFAIVGTLLVGAALVSFEEAER